MVSQNMVSQSKNGFPKYGFPKYGFPKYKELPVFLYCNTEYKNKDGIIDKDKSNYFRETLCIGNDETSEEESDLESVSESESETE